MLAFWVYLFKIYLELDPEKHEVRAMDQEYTVSWKVGVPSLTLSANQQMGQIHKFDTSTNLILKRLKNRFKIGMP